MTNLLWGDDWVQKMLLSSKTAVFADLWYRAQAAAHGNIPFKRDIPLRDLAPLMPWLIMHKRNDQGRTFCLLFGTALAELFGRDMTGSCLEEAMALEDSSARQASFTAYGAEFGEEAPFCRYVLGKFNSKLGLQVQFESLAFPYVEEADQSLRTIVHVLPLQTMTYGDSFTPQFSEQTVKMFHPMQRRPDWLHMTAARKHVEQR